MSKRKTLHPESSSSSQPITALSQRKDLLHRLNMLKTRRDFLQSHPRSGSELELNEILTFIALVENFLLIQQAEVKEKPVQPLTKKLRQNDEKISYQISSSNVNLIPFVIWVYTAGFLNKTDRARLAMVSTLLASSCMEYARESYRREFSYFDQSFPIIPSQAPFKDQFNLLSIKLKRFEYFSTLVDKSYAPLFLALQEGKEDTAINFINSRLESKQDSLKKIIEMVFMQKRSDGETAISLANRLNMNAFLRHCFKQLIEKAADEKPVPGEQKSVIKMGRLDRILGSLDNEMQEEGDIKASVEAVWMYALAHVCKQDAICAQISSKPHWNKTCYLVEDPDDQVLGIDLAVIAALLASPSLMEYVLDNISLERVSQQMHGVAVFQPGQILYNSEIIRTTPLTVALIGNNVELVNRLLPIAAPTADLDEEYRTHDMSFLLIFDLKNRNRDRFEESLREVDAEILATSLKIYPNFLEMDTRDKMHHENEDQNQDFEYTQYTFLNLALASNWREGISLVWQAVDRLIQGGEMTPIVDHTLLHQNIVLLNMLCEHGLSLTAQYEIPGVGFEYPLITAIRLDNGDEVDVFISKKIGKVEALKQIDNRLENAFGLDDVDSEGVWFSARLLGFKQDLTENLTETVVESEEGEEEGESLPAENMARLFSLKRSGSPTTEKTDSPSNSC